MSETLYDKLTALEYTNEYAFHMPGHKRKPIENSFEAVMKMDITEIEGFDNLHHPEGILKDEQEFAAQMYGAKKTFFLVNGSTCGVLAAICAVTKEGEPLILARNSHKSAYHAVSVKGLKTSYVYPEFVKKKPYIHGKITSRDVAKQMDETDAKVVFLTSPTYEGVVSDIAEIAEEVHKRNGILIVDEAHGAHLGFHAGFPKSAITEGADIVVQSMHKTLPSLTQTALLHVCSERVSASQIAAQLSVFQTSSPSYVLMGSMSRCLHFLQEQGKEKFDIYYTRLQSFYEKIKHLKHLQVVTPSDAKDTFLSEFDPSKIIICAENLADKKGNPYEGKELAKDLLRKYQLQMEMVSENYVLAMTSICDTQEGFDRLEQALFEIDGAVIRKDAVETATEEPNIIDGSSGAVMTIKVALDAERERVAWNECEGKISGEYICLYPPGSPILTPGERISKEIWKKINRYKERGLNLQGPEDYCLETLWIVKN